MKRLLYIIAAAPLLLATSCLEDKTTDYTEWKETNERYVADAAAETIDGKPVYDKYAPEWAPNGYVLIKWHNDRALTAKNLSPLDNSTVDVKYALENIEGTTLQTSYASTTYGDSIYRCKPNENIIGFWAALTQMHVGDSVTMVIPYQSGYGSSASGSILPFSTLIYHVKLKNIVAYETPN